MTNRDASRSPAEAPAPRIAVLGSFMQALCWNLDRLPSPGESVTATGFDTEPAGKGLAVAVACRRLGAAVDVVLSVGHDAAGDALLRRLGDEDLSARHVHRRTGRSGHGAGWLTRDGGNAIATFAGANAQLNVTQVAQADAVWARAALVYAQLETPVESAREAFVRARRHGRYTVLNASPWQPLDAALLACTQTLILNEEEARHCLPGGVSDLSPMDAQQISDRVPKLWVAWAGGPERRLVVTLGARGSAAFAPSGERWFSPPFALDGSNSIGAGDAFAAGWCLCVARGESMDAALRYGNACGAFAASRSGILDALPFAADIDAMLRPASEAGSDKRPP